MERKLGSIKKILDIVPIENADAIELAILDGWQVVIKKGQFAIGDDAVYFEIDSVFPTNNEHFAFLDGRALKTRKIRGTLSQGILFPLSILPENFNSEEIDSILGVVKKEDMVLNNEINPSGSFPTHLFPKTDEERIQNINIRKVIGEWILSEKLDGQSISVYRQNGEVFVCTRNLGLKKPEINIEGHRIWGTLLKQNVLENIPEGIVVQGELIGNGIQANKYKLTGNKWFPFKAWELGTFKKLNIDEFISLCNDVLKIESVPILGRYTITEDTTKEELLKLAEDVSKLNNSTHREGIVFINPNPVVNSIMSFKAISNKFLLKYDE